MKAIGFKYPGTELDALNEGKNYYRWILHRFRPYVGKKVIEVGAGIGTFSRFLLEDAKVDDLTLVEPAENLQTILEGRFSDDPRVKLVRGYLEALIAAPCADSVVLVNVLEHVADDEAFLKRTTRLLNPGGRILLLVPAVPALYGSLDKAFEHFRRYTKPSLAGKLEKAGLQVEHLRYFNFPGLFSWFLAGRVFGWKTLGTTGVLIFDRCIVPWASRLEKLWEPPTGLSLIAVASQRGAIR